MISVSAPAIAPPPKGPAHPPVEIPPKGAGKTGGKRLWRAPKPKRGRAAESRPMSPGLLISLMEAEVTEALDDPYRWRGNFETEDVEDDEEEGSTKTVLLPVQMATFTGEDGTPYRWYARQSRFSSDNWEIAFGVDKGTNARGGHDIDLGLTGKGNAFRVLATVIEITTAFVEFDETHEVRYLNFTSEGDNRTRLYASRVIPRIPHFEIERQETHGTETSFLLARVS